MGRAYLARRQEQLSLKKKKEGTECSREEQDKLSRVDGYQGLRIWEGVVYAFFGIMCNITHFNQWRQEERGM